MTKRGQGKGRQVRFELPHAIVTLTEVAGELVEIEVWPKSGVSAFVVVDVATARQIAEALLSMAPGTDEGPASEPPEPDRDDDEDVPVPAGIIDLASRRRPPKGA